MKNNKISFLGGFFLLIAIGIFIIDIFLIKKDFSFINSSERVEGSVISIIERGSSVEHTYSPEVYFIDSSGKDIKYIPKVSSSKPDFRVGEKISILYQKNDPYNAKINSFMYLWLKEIIVAHLGLFFLILGLPSLIAVIKNKKRKKLFINGEKISAKVSSIEKTKNFYKIIAQWINPSNNTAYIFKSDYMEYNPESIVLNKDIFVFIDPNNPKKYYMDISMLPKQGN
jgi:hypothetical protein